MNNKNLSHKCRFLNNIVGSQYLKSFLIVFFLFLRFNAIGQSQELDSIVFEDNIPEESAFSMPNIYSRLMKPSGRHPGCVILTAENNWLDGLSENQRLIIETSIKSAVSIWELFLNGDTLRINIQQNNNHPCDIYTTVFYSPVNDTAFAVSYVRNYKFYPPEGNLDAKIEIKNSIDWEVGYEGKGKNLTYALMQAFVHAMGFGSSLRCKENNTFIVSATRKYSAFDYLLFSSNGQQLSDIPIIPMRYNQALESFAKSGTVYAYQLSDAYKVYAPSAFEDGVSLQYFDGGNSLMSYPMPNYLEPTVDSVTLRLLSEIGWNILPAESFEITSSDVDSTGITTAYASHYFHLTGDTDGLSNHTWLFILPLKNGGRDTVSVSNTLQSMTSSITNEAQYATNDNNEIVGEVLYTGIKNDEVVSASYQIRLQLRPHIVNVSVLECSQSSNDEDLFDLTLGIRYEGCYYIYATAEEEYSAICYPRYSYVPYYTQLKFTDLDSWGSVWITVTARNAYGTATTMVEIENPQNSFFSRKTDVAVVKCDEYNDVSVYDLNGRELTSHGNLKDLSTYCTSGKTYVLYLYKDKNIVKKIKYLCI